MSDYNLLRQAILDLAEAIRALSSNNTQLADSKVLAVQATLSLRG